MDSHIGTVIIPAMGSSQRFKDAGYQDHKALLQIGDLEYSAPMIRRIINTIPSEWAISVVAPYEFRDAFQLAIGGRGKVIPLRGTTRGQADTLLYGVTGLNAAKPVAVMNCDVEFKHEVVSQVLRSGEDVVVVHDHSEGEPIFSYVRFQNGRSVAFSEKQRISNWAQSGLWCFKKAGTLHRALVNHMQNDPPHSNGEFYLTGALNHYPPMSAFTVLPHEWHDYGTPKAITDQGMTIGR